MCPGVGGFLYVLVMKNDMSRYVWLKAAKDATAVSTAEELINWFSSFGVVNNWVSDRGSHFRNELVDVLRQKVKSKHHFTLAYCPWSNGTVEVVCREILRASRALLSEYQLPIEYWPQVLPIVQSILNNSIIDRLGKHCPLTAFTGLPQDSPLLAIKTNKGERIEVKNIDQVRAEQCMNLTKMQEAFFNMHKTVSASSDRKRQSSVDSHNRKTNFRQINFTEGDFVLKGLRQHERGRKPALKWHGPFRVVSCVSEYIYSK